MSMASREAPISSTPNFSSTPSRTRSSAQLSAGLAAHRRQQRVRPLLLDDPRDRAPVDRLDVDRVGHLRVGHDRRGIGVDQDDAVALLAQRLAGLRAGVIELAGLADDDRPGADDQDALDVGALGHQPATRSSSAAAAARAQLLLQAARHQAARNARTAAACRAGPGLASGWPWKLNAGRSVRAIPCSEPSNSERWVARRFAGSEASSTAKPWFWLVISTRPAGQVLHRMIGAVMAELHLDGPRAAGQRQQLVAEADAEDRDVGLENLADGLDRVVAGLRDRRARWTGTRRPARAPARPRPGSRRARPSRGSRDPRAAAGCCA